MTFYAPVLAVLTHDCATICLPGGHIEDVKVIKIFQTSSTGYKHPLRNHVTIGVKISPKQRLKLSNRHKKTEPDHEVD